MAIEQKITEYLLYIVYFVFLYYSFFWLIVLATYKKDEKKIVTNTALPHVTIAVPVFNEEKTIEGTIHSLFSLDYPKDKLTVICVNDGSKDGSAHKLHELSQKYRNLIIINQKNQGKYIAVNAALARCTSPYFGCLDADSFVHKDSLRYLISDFLADEKLVASMPIMQVKNVNNWLERIQDVEYMTSILLKKLHESRDCVNVTPGPFTIFRSDILRKVGGYKAGHMTEDLEMALRLQANHHYQMKQNTNAIVYTKTPSNLRAYIKQRLRWNSGTILNAWDYKKLMFKKEYGDLGFIQLPMIATAGLLAAVVFLFIIINQIRPIYDQVKMLALSHFDIMTYIRTMHFEINILTWDSVFLFLSVFMTILMIVYLYNSIKIAKGKCKLSDVFSFSIYFYAYGLLSSGIWFYTMIKLLTKRRITWR